MPNSNLGTISDANGAFIFLQILKRWKGSLYKLAWVDLMLYLGAYYLISFTYRFVLPDPQKRVFEDVVRYCEGMKGNIPVSFLLGFFVSEVIGRWYRVYMYIPWMNEISYTTASYVNCGDKKVARDIRISLMRYANLAWILLMRRISDQIADRFKHLDEDATSDDADGRKDCCKREQSGKLKHGKNHPWSISEFRKSQKRVIRTPRTPMDSGLEAARKQANLYRLTVINEDSPCSFVPVQQEKKIFDSFEGEDEKSIRATLQGFNKDRKVRETFGKIITETEIRAFEEIAQQYFRKTRDRYLPEYWVPLQWAARLVQKAGLHGNIPDSRMIGYMLQELSDFRSQLQTLEIYNSIVVPLVYTQVVIIAVYSYFACEILASQFLEVPKTSGDATVDFFVPVFSIFYFLFLVGWLKVALCAMNPFGDDDEDFATSDILDYNLCLSYQTVLIDDFSFPNDLTPPTFQLNEMEGVENDNLNEFIDNVSTGLESADNRAVLNELTNLEIRRRCCNCLPKVGPITKRSTDEEM